MCLFDVYLCPGICRWVLCVCFVCAFVCTCAFACMLVCALKREMCLHKAAMFVVFACMCIDIDVPLHVFALASVMNIYFNYVYMCVCG